jgi:hypothetical protein
LLVAPTREKEYDVFGAVLQPLWDEARTALDEANRLIIIGYSFPTTDLRARELIHGFRGLVEVVNPSPKSVLDALHEAGVDAERIAIFQGTLSDYNKR